VTSLCIIEPVSLSAKEHRAETILFAPGEGRGDLMALYPFRFWNRKDGLNGLRR